LNGGNDFGARTHQQSLVGAVGGRRVEQALVLGSDPLGVAVGDGRKEQKAGSRYSEALFVNTTLAQQYRLPAVKQRMDRRAPLLERGLGKRRRHLAASRARTSGRRSGGTVLGGCRRGASPASSRVVTSVTSATAVSKGSALSPVGRVMPLT